MFTGIYLKLTQLIKRRQIILRLLFITNLMTSFMQRSAYQLIFFYYFHYIILNTFLISVN